MSAPLQREEMRARQIPVHVDRELGHHGLIQI